MLLLGTLMASTTQSGHTQRLITSARFSSKKEPPTETLSLHFIEASPVETCFKSLKAKLIWRQKWQTRQQAEAAIFQHINGFYNTRRRHSYLGGIGPLAFKAKGA